MKEKFLAIMLLLPTLVNAQNCTGTLYVSNTTSCDLVFQIYATDDGVGPCVAYFSDMQLLPAGTPATALAIPANLSWSSGSPSNNCINNDMTIPGFVVDYDASTTCNSSTGYLIGDPTTCTWNNSVTLPSCACSGLAINAYWQNPFPGIYRLIVQ